MTQTARHYDSAGRLLEMRVTEPSTGTVPPTSTSTGTGTGNGTGTGTGNDQ